jgi:Protein of unknown function (DUF2510)
VSDTPAGWYPHPHQVGQDLYWDGSGWTAEARPTVRVPPTPTVAGVTPARPRAAWAAGTLIPIGVVVVIGAVLPFVVTPPSPRSTVSKALAGTLAQRSAAVTISGSEHVDGIVVPVTGSGLFDFIHNEGSMVLNVSAAGQTIREKTITSHQSVYLNLGPLISKVLPGKSWVVVDASQLSAKGGASSGLAPGGPGAGNPGALFNILGNGANAVSALGASTINGVPVQGYLIVVSPATVKAEISNPRLPQWERRAARSVSDAKVGYKVFIGPSGLVYRLTTGVAETAGGGQVEEFISMDFAHFGTAVNVTVPPTDQVGSYSAFIKAAEALQSGTLN